MQVAIPEWEGRVSPVFDTAGRVVLLQIEDGREAGRREAQFVGMPPPLRVQRLVELGIDVLICGAISRRLSAMCLSCGITVIPWVSGALEEVLQAYLAGSLPDPEYTMPGCCGQRMRARRGRGGGRRGNAGRGRGRGRGKGGGQ
jgi:predicted Fe-Mo cluster-binding NifX family protein